MHPLYRFGHTLSRAISWLWYDFRVIHPERLIRSGPCLIVCNHESFLDPPVVGCAYDEPIWYLARKSLFTGAGKWAYPRLNCIPVDQDGPDFSGLKNIIKLLQQGERVLLFPEGARTLTGEIQKGEAGVGLVIAKARVPVQPLHLHGTYEALPRGSSRPRFSKFRLVVGEPIHFTPEELASRTREGYQALSDRVMREIAALEIPDGQT